MSSPDDFDVLAPRVRTMQIFVAALVMGCLVFLAIVLGLRLTGHAQPPPATPVVTYVGIGFAAFVLGPYAVVSTVVSANARKRLAGRFDAAGGAAGRAELAGSLCAVYQTRLMGREALLEFPTFFQLIAYLLEGQPLSLLVAAIFLAGMIAQFPTLPRVASWIARQEDLILQEQQAGG